MSDLIVITFENEGDGPAALRSLRGLEKEAGLRLDDTAVIVKGADGAVRVKNELDSGTEAGAVVGGVIGALVFVMFPVAGIVAGAAAGGLVGHALDRNIDQTFVRDVSAALTPGSSALFAHVREENPAALVAALGAYRGRVYQTTLAPDVEEEIQQALTRG
jgi:uncharacterized membrane protein